MKQPRYRPSWIVLARGTLKQVKPVAEERWPGSGTPWERWGIVRSRKGYVAVYEPEPGAQCSGEEELGVALSRECDGRVYVLTLAPEVFDPDKGVDRTSVYAGGKLLGTLKIEPAGTIVTHFGCEVPGLVEEDHQGLDPEELAAIVAPPPKPRRGEPKFFKFAASSWRHILEHERDDIGYILDDPDDERFMEVFAALEHADAGVRMVAASLLYYARPTAEGRGLVAERRESETDPAVRRAIEETLEYWREWDE